MLVIEVSHVDGKSRHSLIRTPATRRKSLGEMIIEYCELCTRKALQSSSKRSPKYRSSFNFVHAINITLLTEYGVYAQPLKDSGQPTSLESNA